MCNVKDRLGHSHEVNAEIKETEIKMSWSTGKEVI